MQQIVALVQSRGCWAWQHCEQQWCEETVSLENQI